MPRIPLRRPLNAFFLKKMHNKRFKMSTIFSPPQYNGNEVQSNTTDPDSAKMKTGHGVIQGYVGVAAVDSKHQVVVSAEAFGQGQEHGLLEPLVEQIDKAFDKEVVPPSKTGPDSGR